MVAKYINCSFFANLILCRVARAACAKTGAKVKSVVQFEDKAQYNCFHYRLAKAPSDLQEKWDSLKLTNTEEAQTFIKDMAAVTKGNYDAVYRKKSTNVIDEKGTEVSEGWISYKKFADDVGDIPLFTLLSANFPTVAFVGN